MLKSFFSFFSPQIIYHSKSKFNPDLRVQRSLGKNLLYVSQTQQSGPWEDKIWNRALEHLSKTKDTNEVKQVLILGLGAGNLAKIINHNFPKANITGVEIDPEVIKVGKQFFELGKISNLQTEIGDAFNFIKKRKATYDLIFIDLFVGQNSPKKIDSASFLQNLSQTMSKSGMIVFNRLTTKNATFELDNFVDKIQKYLKIDTVVKVDFNSIVFCSRKRF